MRVSVDPSDPGYANYVGRDVRVFLDGTERNGVFTADEEKRVAVMAARDERGNVRILNEQVVREVWTGNVHIEVKPYASGGFVTSKVSVAIGDVDGASPTAEQVAAAVRRSIQRASRRNS